MLSCVAGLGDITDAIFAGLSNATVVFKGVGRGTVPGLKALAGADPEALTEEPGVGGPGGEGADDTDVAKETPLWRGAIELAEDVVG
jgi:hypothetical protein